MGMGGWTRVWMAATLCMFLAAPAAAAEVCGLVAPAEAEVLLGGPVQPPRAKAVVGFAAGSSCTYLSKPASVGAPVGSLRLTLYDAQTMAAGGGVHTDPAKFYERGLAAKKNAGAALEPVAGLGQAATWEPAAYMLHVLTEKGYFTLVAQDVTKITGTNQADLQKKLAEHRKGLAIKAAGQWIIPRL